MACISFPSCTAPSSPPTAFTVTVLSDTSLRLNWSAPPEEVWNDLSLKGFNCSCVVQNTVTSSIIIRNCTSDYARFQNVPVFDCEITGLQPLTEYLCSVSVHNDNGSSPYTQEKLVKTTGKVASLFVPHNNAYRML